MKKLVCVLSLMALLSVAGCRVEGPGPFFDGDFAAAQAEATSRDALIMIDFFTDWCSWCRRLDEDTFSDDRVRAELESLVAVRVNAEDGGQDLAAKYGVDGFPTIIFTDSVGVEVDRIVGYLPPERFVEQLVKIRTGDTFVACLSRLDEDPADHEALTRSVEGLLERSDPAGAIQRLEAFDSAAQGHDGTDCGRLMFAARSELHNRSYQKAAKFYRLGTRNPVDVPDGLGTTELSRLMRSDYDSLDGSAQAEGLRAARREDASALMASVGSDEGWREPAVLADLAYAGGLYDEAGALYVEWFEREGEGATAGELNRIAWLMYLMQRELETACLMAERAYADDGDPDIGDTAARILYTSGRTEEAIALQTSVVEKAGDDAPSGFVEAVELMRAGAALGDRPSFESFPGEREG